MTAPVPVNLVSAFKTFTGSTNVAKDYYDALRVGGLAPTWYQCISSRNRQEWDTWGKSISGLTWFGDDANVVLNSLTVFPRKIRPLGKDWVLLTDPILLPAARHLPRVAVIVHDMREFSVHRRGRLATWVYHQLFRNIRKVSHIICVSESTRNALTSFARLSVPITVVHPSARVAGNVESHIARSQSRLRDDQPMRVLYMAADRPYKNIEFFIQLAKHFDPPSTKGTRFVFTLVSRLGPSSRATLSRLHPGNLDVVPRVDEVGPLYDAVDIVVHPSMIEGFGLPLAEAMQFGIPILATDIPAIREVVGAGGVMLPPADLNAWTVALERSADPSAYSDSARASASRGRAFTTEAFRARALPALEFLR